MTDTNPGRREQKTDTKASDRKKVLDILIRWLRELRVIQKLRSIDDLCHQNIWK